MSRRIFLQVGDAAADVAIRETVARYFQRYAITDNPCDANCAIVDSAHHVVTLDLSHPHMRVLFLYPKGAEVPQYACAEEHRGKVRRHPYAHDGTSLERPGEKAFYFLLDIGDVLPVMP